MNNRPTHVHPFNCLCHKCRPLMPGEPRRSVALPVVLCGIALACGIYFIANIFGVTL